ncbi:MATE family efflux transporter [Parabacteroides sp. 52]|uniref:MATE family efflux transporter n=1 Tax=unclassified Parabacteroides TaxID=2649774 RepID=UPI0013D15723|nr:MULTISPECIES: MATE family efflux transporter [unclassified Parabacteroides]MDH6534282.1 putative MATE family efflux protein [Parabacteroides sp. PM5-20]NDV55334.1 MATE family efflux transporter [Parabacteroides sp. 52]
MNTTTHITQRLEHEKIAPLLLHYAIPAVIGTMVNALYNIVDRIFIGQGVGALAISGLTLTFPILLFIQAFGMLVGVGTATRISIYLGRKQNDLAENVLGNALVLTFILSACTLIPCLLFMDELLLAFGGSEQTIPYAKDYLRITIPGNIFAALSFSFNAVMRASGYPRKAMFTMLIGAFLNIILDAVFIFGMDLGIKGAAVATVISMAVSALFVMHHFLHKKSLIRFRKNTFTLKKPLIWGIVSIGISPFAMQLAGSLVNVVMNHSLKTYGGDLAIGANGIISSVAMLLVMLNIGIAQGMQPIVGYNHGAGLHKRVLATLRLVIITATCITGAGFLCSTFSPEWIVRAFSNDPEMIAISSNGLRISLLLFLPVGSQIAITQFFQSIGIAWKAMFLSLSRQCLFLIPAILLLPPFFDLDGVWFAAPLSDFAAAVTAWFFLAHHIKRYKNSL